MEYQLLGADWYPDFIYADDFNPLLPVPNLPSLGALLVKWSMHNQRALYDLLKAMRSRSPPPPLVRAEISNPSWSTRAAMHSSSSERQSVHIL